MYEWVETRTIEEVLFDFIEVMDNPRVGSGYGEEPQKLSLYNNTIIIFV